MVTPFGAWLGSPVDSTRFILSDVTGPAALSEDGEDLVIVAPFCFVTWGLESGSGKMGSS